MPAAADFRSIVRGHLWRAALLRRAPLWALALLPPLLLCAQSLAHRAAPAASGVSSSFAIPLLLLAVCLLWLAVDVHRLRRRIAVEWTRWLDAAIPGLEDSSALLDGEPTSAIARLQRQRLQARLPDLLRKEDYRSIARRRVRINLLPLAFSLLAAGAFWGWQKTHATAPGAIRMTVAKTAAPGDVIIRVTPPAYTRIAAFETDARDIQVPQYSDIRWCHKRGGEPPTMIELSDGQSLPLERECARWTASESLFWRARSQAGARYDIRVIPDQAPQVAIVAPQDAIHVLAATARSVQLSVATRDDYGIARASLHMTLARGSGENIRFSDREMPLPPSGDARTRNWQRNWSLAELGMEPGDELYFFVRATDNAPDHQHTAQSPTYTLRLPGPASESVESSALPSMVKPENLRSQRQIIIDTEQLLADLPTLGAATLRERSEAIAGDQGQLRRRYGQFLGEESTLFGDEHGHEHEGEPARGAAKDGGIGEIVARFGHAHDETDNATIFDPKTKEVLRRALKAMWEAEKFLRAITPKPALPPEYKALEAIKELQQAERVYLHRTAFVSPALKEGKRLTGDVVGAQSYKRAQGTGNDAVPREVRELVQALASDAALPALWSKSAREIIAARIGNDEQKLAAQRAVQDVADGCTDCRAVLRAWLRATLTEVPVLLQAQPRVDSQFQQAWRGKGQP
ncbi:MAG: DUF4175 family protein [Pseudomonadota bacterium]